MVYYHQGTDLLTEIVSKLVLLCCQRTLVITAPDDNKEQEKFLGYRWSNRKGSEGIQVFNPGGMLYNEGDRWSDETLSSLIRDMFSNNERELSYCDKYYYYLKTSEMLDFKGAVFNKLIKPVKPRVRSNADGAVKKVLI